MVSSTTPTVSRPSQIRSSTLFVSTLIVLIVFVLVVLFVKVVWPFINAKPVVAMPPAPAPPPKLTVAASNILDTTQVQSSQIKTIDCPSQEDYNRRVSDARKILVTRLEDYKQKLKHAGKDTNDVDRALAKSDPERIPLKGVQPIGRTTLVAINAEDPLFEDQFEPLHSHVRLELTPGKQSVIVEVPAKYTMVQVGDYVDVSYTLGSDNPNWGFGPGQTATAIIASGAKVIARFGSTRTGAQPPPGDKRTYTLEVTPYRMKLIELCKGLNGNFSLSVVKPGPDRDLNDPALENRNYVTTNDLAKLFGIEPPRPGVGPHEMEHYTGIQYRGTTQYSRPRSRTPEPQPAPAIPKPAAPPSPKPSGVVTSPAETSPATDSEASDASSSNLVNYGFRAPGESPTKGCPTCGKKK